METEGRQELVALLRGSPVFSVLSEEQVAEIGQLARIEGFSPNELILKEGEPSTRFYLILEGQVQVYPSNGEPRRLARGEFFGETALVTKLTRSRNVLALRKTRCIVLQGSELRSYPSLVLKLVEASSRQRHGPDSVKSSVLVTKSGPGEERGKEEAIQFESKRAKTIFGHIVKCFIGDYMVNRLYFEQAGWRSLGEISVGTKIPLGTLYGRRGSFGPAIAELRSRGLIETRVFKGQRGRGGDVVKVRIAYDKEPVKRLVDQAVLRRK